MEDGKRTAKNHSLSRQFVMKALNILKPNGYIVFILPDNWMSYADNNPLPMLLTNLQIIVLNIGEAKKWFPTVGSSFTYFIIKNTPNIGNNNTKIITKYGEEVVKIPAGIPFIPLQYNNIIASIFNKVVFNNLDKYPVQTSSYLHKYTKKIFLNTTKDEEYQYKIIHTPNQIIWSKIPHKFQQGWKVFLPTTTYYNPFCDKDSGMTQSIAFILCNNEEECKIIQQELSQPVYRFVIELTRYGNFNNQRVMQHLTKYSLIELTQEEKDYIDNFFLTLGR